MTVKQALSDGPWTTFIWPAEKKLIFLIIIFGGESMRVSFIFIFDFTFTFL